MRQDYVTAQERVSILQPKIVDYADHECCGCGRTAEQISIDEGCNDVSFDENSKTTNSGNLYCHIDCYKDCF